MPAPQSLIGSDVVAWIDIVRPAHGAETLARLVYPRSLETAVDRIAWRYPHIERDRIGRVVRHARQLANADKHVAAERVVRDFEAFAARYQPTERPKRRWFR